MALGILNEIGKKDSKDKVIYHGNFVIILHFDGTVTLKTR